MISQLEDLLTIQHCKHVTFILAGVNLKEGYGAKKKYCEIPSTFKISINSTTCNREQLVYASIGDANVPICILVLYLFLLNF
jgi:hypothetical protein